MDENNNNFNENDFELDPDMVEVVESESKNQNNESNDSFDFKDFGTEESDIEPVAPIMPKIEKNEYIPIESHAGNKGMKVFAIVVAVVVVLCSAVTGGYFLGVGKASVKTESVDLASKPSAENAKTTSEIYNAVNSGIVGIYVYNNEGIQSSATGVVYSNDGYIVTNDHIYDGISSPKFKVYTYDGKMLPATYVAGDTRSDLAVLKVDSSAKLKAVEFGNSNELVVGETVVAIGRPNGATLPSSLSEGVVSATSRRVSITTSYTGKYIQTDTAINPGSSGGALCNVYGQVIGITSAKIVADEYEGVGFAIPTTIVKNNVESLIKNKTVKGRAKLGISYQFIDELTAELSKTPCGLKIASIDEESDLYGRSVQKGDIITHINGKKITSSETVLDVIDSSSPDDSIDFTVYFASSKKSGDITVKLLEDKGESSYESGDSASGDKDNSSNKYNSSEFSFPNGD